MPTETDTNITDGTVETVLAFVDGNREKAKTIWKQERANKDRVSVRRGLVKVIAETTPTDDLPVWARNAQIVDGKARFQLSNTALGRLQAYGDEDIVADFDVRTTSIRKDFDDADALATIGDALLEAAAAADSIVDVQGLAKMGLIAKRQAYALETYEPALVEDVDAADEVDMDPVTV